MRPQIPPTALSKSKGQTIKEKMELTTQEEGSPAEPHSSAVGEQVRFWLSACLICRSVFKNTEMWEARAVDSSPFITGTTHFARIKLIFKSLKTKLNTLEENIILIVG